MTFYRRFLVVQNAEGPKCGQKADLSWQVFFCKVGLRRQSYACTANVYNWVYGVSPCRFSLQSMEKDYRIHKVTLLLKGKDCVCCGQTCNS